MQPQKEFDHIDIWYVCVIIYSKKNRNNELIERMIIKYRICNLKLNTKLVLIWTKQ